MARRSLVQYNMVGNLGRKSEGLLIRPIMVALCCVQISLVVHVLISIPFWPLTAYTVLFGNLTN